MKTKLLTLVGLHLGLAAVVAQPVITNQPQNQTAIAGSNVTFTVGATGAPPLSYQWRSHLNNPSFTNIPFGTEATLVLTNVQPTSRRFGVVVTDGGGLSVTSSPLVTVTVVSPPSIATEPSNQNAVAGEITTFSVAASGTAPLSYQWYFNGQPRNGANASNLTFASVQFNNAGAYQIVVTNLYGAATSHVATLTVVPPTLFTRVTNGPVVTDLGQNTGCVWGDFNNDGFLDLYVAQFSAGTNSYYRNNGDGTFTRITHGDYLVNGDYNLGVQAADYDNDGHLDLVVASGFRAARRNAVFHNKGDGTFTRVNAGGITNQLGFYVSAAWADQDNDGFVDLFLTDAGNANESGGTNQLWNNNGDGTFTRITTGPVVNDLSDGRGVSWSDYDNDGRVDLLVLNTYATGGTNYLYHNDGNSSFSRVLDNPIATDILLSVNNWGGSQAGDWGDYDNDGFLDLFVVNRGGVRNHLYHNNGGGSFSNVNVGPMLIPISDQPHVASWGDYDNDGYLDLFLSYANQSRLYRNNGDGTFAEIRSIVPVQDNILSSPSDYNTLAWVDYDNDGFLDVYLTQGTGSAIQEYSNFLYHNSGNSNAWLEVKCVGTVANRSAIGTRIRMKATIGSKTFWQMRELSAGGGWDLAKPLVAHFGLGNATNVETLRIEWPSGIVQELHNLAAKQFLAVTEPPRLLASKTNGEPQFSIKGRSGSDYQVDTSTNLTTWSSLGIVTITNQNGTARIIETNTPVADQRFYRAVSR